MIGIDIDHELIRRAELNKISFFRERKRSSDAVRFEGDLEFVQGDAVSDTGKSAQYSVISCFSVTKWIHLNHGDEGLLQLFDNIVRMLRVDGIFILEAQPWKSYQKRRRLNDVIATNFRTISIRPTDFPTRLEQCGMELILSCPTVQAKSLGFSRPIQIFKKLKADI